MAVDPDVADLMVLQEGDVVRGADARGYLVGDEAGDSHGLAYPLRLQPVLDRHVEEVGVAPDVQLVRGVDVDAPLVEELCHGPVEYGSPNLAFDVVPRDW